MRRWPSYTLQVITIIQLGDSNLSKGDTMFCLIEIRIGILTLNWNCFRLPVSARDIMFLVRDEHFKKACEL